MEKYRMVALDLAQKIESGHYPRGIQLPLETELCAMYQVSRITIKKATDLLVQLGIITKRRGAGSFVQNTEHLHEILTGEQVQFTGFTRQFAGRRVSAEVHQFVTHPATGEAAEKMCLTEKDLVYYICRTRFVDDEPYVVEYAYLPVGIVPGLDLQIVSGSIYAYILDTLHLKPQSARRTLRSLLPTEAEKQYFHISEPFSILEIEQVASLDDGRIFEFSKTHCRSDRYAFRYISVW